MIKNIKEVDKIIGHFMDETGFFEQSYYNQV